MVFLHQEARERRIISNVKPFIETLQVTNPVPAEPSQRPEASLEGAISATHVCLVAASGRPLPFLIL